MATTNLSTLATLRASFRNENSSKLRYATKLVKEPDDTYTLYNRGMPIFRLSNAGVAIYPTPTLNRSLLYSLVNEFVLDGQLLRVPRRGYKLVILGEKGHVMLPYHQWTTLSRSEKQRTNYPAGEVDRVTIAINVPRQDIAPFIALAIRERKNYSWPPDYQIKREGNASVLLYRSCPVLRLTSMHCQVCPPVDVPIELQSLLSTLIRTLAEDISPTWRRERLWVYKGKLRILRPCRPEEWTTFYACDNKLPTIKLIDNLRISVVRYTKGGEYYWLLDRNTENGVERIGSSRSFVDEQEAYDNARDYVRHYYPLERIA